VELQNFLGNSWIFVRRREAASERRREEGWVGMGTEGIRKTEWEGRK
jgi:hypothetical protein